MKNKIICNTFKELFNTNLRVFKQVLVDNILDTNLWASSWILVNSYLMPSFGLSPTYGVFLLAGLCAATGLFTLHHSVIMLISDIEDEHIIYYYLTLPIYPSFVFIQLILFYAFKFMLLSASVLIVGKIILWNRFNLTLISWWKLVLFFIVLHIFYGAFTVWAASYVKNKLKIGAIWRRLIHPLWFFGCFQFSWLVLYNKVPSLGLISLLNPVVYAMEGMRNSLLNTDEFLNFWFCIAMLIFFTILTSWHGIKRMQRRLDFV